MKRKAQHGQHRRERKRATAALNNALDAFVESQRLARAGNFIAAERAVRLGERQSNLAERLIDLKATLRRIAEAKFAAERALDAAFSERDAALKEREQKLHLAELSLKHRAQHTPPIDPEAARLRERLARLRIETKS